MDVTRKNLVREKIVQLFTEVGTRYMERDVTEFDLHNKGDIDQYARVHAFYRLSSDPSKVIHLKAYPADEQRVTVEMRLMDYNKVVEMRRSRNGSIEPLSQRNEDEATIQRFPRCRILFDSRVLEKVLGDNFEALPPVRLDYPAPIEIFS